MTLTALTIVAIVSIDDEHKPAGGLNSYEYVDTLNKKHKKHKKHKKRPKREHWFNSAEWMEIAMCIFYTYSTLLAIFALTLSPRWRSVAGVHLVLLLLIAFAIYVWRDLMPFATLTLRPVDLAGGWLTWSRIAILGLIAVIIPLCIPRRYTPLDLKQAPATPNPEQTASIISLVSYQFMDPLVWSAYRGPKLEFDQLPPLADYDHASYLKQQHLDQLDPFKSPSHPHLFWNLMRVFWKEYCIMAVMLVIRALTEFAGPLGLRFILKYLEDSSNAGPIRPWFVFWMRMT
ncbi:ATP-binding cassette transporter abc4 [Ceratobasidium sp. AG-Ba]|nr:ATP-binding cassette transporter abc4 [Ceratobasidium sp. AG-Ba]QRW14575.1 hypothetical protein RhiLY_13574 [Ceratobasidium sp. AG-Ba]